jgi:FixJ family two-component response regulator
MLARHRLKMPVWGGFARAPEGRLSKAPLIAIVEDDEFLRDSTRRFIRSLGYPVEAFPSAADFLVFRRLTAYPEEARRARALKSGVVCYLLTPFDDNDLMDCVRKAVEGGKPPAEDS